LRSDSPVQVSGITNATEVKAGSNFACARIVNATVRCWGDGADGRLGNGTTTDSNVPVVVSNLTDAAQVAVGGSHACARRTGGSVVCWGSNASGQLGINVVGGSSTTPQPVTGITNATDIAAGRNNTCARLADNSVKCWGSNSGGQLGNGTTGGVSTVPVTVSGAVGTVANDALGIGTAHVCLRTTSTDLVCWGDNSSFKLGNGVAGDSNVPVNAAITIATGRPALGSDHTCIRKPPSNTVLCWGDNKAGQVGDPVEVYFSSQPVSVFALSDTLDLAAGADNTCAAISDGSIRCWGVNTSGLLGNGSPPPRPTPIPTPIAGNDSVCSLDIDGNGSVDALTDGVLLTRARFGLSGSAVTANALGLGAMRTDWESIRDYLQFNCNMSGLVP
jgi:alpha-tubulin suppressor-like RCC1 family protein